MQVWPKISIVTPTFNCGHLVRKCIESVTSQQYPNVEHIIVDGASTDDTTRVLGEFPHLRWISEKDTGEANALNKALKMVTGDIVCWLNADDYLCPNALEPVARLFREHPTWDLVYGDTNMVDPTGRVLWVKRSSPNTSVSSLARWWENSSMPHQPSMFFSTRLLREVGPLNESLHFSIDLELWFRCAVRTKFHHINQVLSCATQRPDCKSGGTEVEQIKSHWRVLRPFLSQLPFIEQVDFWQEYYFGRLSGLKNHTHLDPTRFPDSEEALLGVIRTINLHPSSLSVLAHLFADQQALLAIVELLNQRGLHFKETKLISIPDRALHSRAPERGTVVVDGIFFERNRTGIYRLWDSVLKSWSQTPFARRVVVLDRSGHAPRYPGIRYRLLPRADITSLNEEAALLTTVCREENAGLFVSTYYTSVVGIPSVMPVYDMIPEKNGWDLRSVDWVAKDLAIKRASAFCCISESTRRDLLEICSDIPPQSAAVTLCGVDRDIFRPASDDEIFSLRQRLNLNKPYFILAGGKTNYKNAHMFFEAMRILPSQHGFKVLVTGGLFEEESLGGLKTGCEIVTATLSDEDLRAAYGGALALVYPSRYEGFGLPVVEAMACGCPVISSPWSSLPEVGGGAAMYITNVATLANALVEVQRPDTRAMLIAAGYEQAKKFSWDTMAHQLQQVFEQVIEATQPKLSGSPLSPNQAHHGKSVGARVIPDE